MIEPKRLEKKTCKERDYFWLQWKVRNNKLGEKKIRERAEERIKKK